MLYGNHQGMFDVVAIAATCTRPLGCVLKKELQNHVKRVTAPYKYPRVVEFVKELPKTTSGKIKRTDIRKSDAEKMNAN